MHLSFDDLPRAEQEYLIGYFGLKDEESELLMLRYVRGFGYERIAAEMHLSKRSVGALLTRARKHVVAIARSLYPIAEPRCQHLIDALGWLELDWPVMASRKSEGK